MEIRKSTQPVGTASAPDDAPAALTADQLETSLPLQAPGGSDGVTPYYKDDAITLYHGDAATTLAQLEPGSVDCVVSSPPYFGLRDYGVQGQLGAEDSPAEFVSALVTVFRHARRVLADDGVLWLNLGDSYAGSWGAQGKAPQGLHAKVIEARANRLRTSRTGSIRNGMPPAKNLLGTPWRVAFALQDDGWILRQEVIWSKRNCMPEAVTDRPSRTHETVFLLTKSPRYWYDADAIREESDPRQQAHNERYAKVHAAQVERAKKTGQPANQNSAGVHSRLGKPGRNARSVWTISSQPFPGAHFATMPPALAKRCIIAGCKPGGIVLDPFSGSGTTGLAATESGRRYVGIDLNDDYLGLSLRTRLRQGVLNLGTGI